ncbi:MAG: glycosyltransferase family 2 protein [Azospirillum sp.]|nr:glycosyltransferase family 2 protein [Azospirillum sp.]MCA3264494.1 glycosyltransferase family 2 protein [Azospirillum sp.]MCZ8122058.1 glycosyltransferase family 2 protein [Magnetospirillum sp.]
MSGVTLLCTVYNKERFLPEVIAAIWRQSPDRPREFLFVDDGSRDRSVAIVRELTRDWPNCRIVERKNGGPSAATNTGIELATMPWLKLVGSDDVLAPYACDRLIQVAETTGAQAVFGRIGFYKDPSEIVFDAQAAARTVATVPADPVAEVIRRGVSGTSPTIFRTETVKRAGMCDPDVFVEDFSLALRVARLGKIARWEHVVTWGPAADETRIMVGQGHQAHHDYALAIVHFLRAHPELEAAYGKLAFRRAAGRAWKYARRAAGLGWTSKYPWLNLRAYLGPPGAAADAIARTMDVYALGEGPKIKPILRVGAYA